MNKCKYLILLWLFVTSFLSILSCSKNDKDSFISNLSNDIVTTFNLGSDKKEPLITDALKYRNENKGMSVIIGGANIFGTDNTHIPPLAGLPDGINWRGLIEFEDYNSVYGRLVDQHLQCYRVLSQAAGKEYITIQVWGVLRYESEDSIKINYAFRFENSRGYAFNLNTIKLLAGQIQEGQNVYDVVLHTHTEATDSESTVYKHSSKGWLARLWELIVGRSSVNEIFEVSSSSSTTPLQIQIGDHIRLQASGEISLGLFAGSGGPDGIDGYTVYCKVPNFRHGALIGRIGDGNWFLVGSSRELVAQTDGLLHLEVNDTDPSNNQGNFSVHCQIEQ